VELVGSFATGLPMFGEGVYIPRVFCSVDRRGNNYLILAKLTRGGCDGFGISNDKLSLPL
jgi:hypothetical protein